MKKKTIGICHYRIGKTDGVSLDIIYKKKTLEQMGYTVKLIAGTRQIGADYIIPELEFDRSEIVKIKENAFFKLVDYDSEQDLLNNISQTAKIIENKFLKIHNKENFDYLFLHNIFSHGRHISAAKSFHDIAAKTNIKIVAYNHDLYWTGSYKDIYKPTCQSIKDFLKEHVPPHSKKIKHVTINSINQQAVFNRIGQKPMVIPDTFEFKQKFWKQDVYNQDFLSSFGLKENDLVVLQATRISKRKGIEVAVDFLELLQKSFSTLIGKTLYNGKKITKDSQIIFIFANYAEKDSIEYLNLLKKKISEVGIKAQFLSSRIKANRGKIKGKKVYSLWDAYVFSDLVTYPSWWEGWGNQFIEAVFAKKPVVVFEYPVFKADIKPEGYDIISLGDKFTKTRDGLIKIPQQALQKAVNKTLKILVDQNINKTLDKNFSIGKNHHSEAVLRKLLLELF
jgi:glycosyltransferase involved in cell wall biosynthesis